MAEFEPTLDYKQVEATLTALTPLSRSLLLREHLDYLEPPARLDAGQALLLWLANALTLVAPVKEAEQRAILVNFGAAVIDEGPVIAKSLASTVEGKMPSFKLALFDRGYVALTGQSGFLNLHTGAKATQLPQAPFESLVYDLTALYVTSSTRMLKMAEAKAKMKEPKPLQSKT